MEKFLRNKNVLIICMSVLVLIAVAVAFLSYKDTFPAKKGHIMIYKSTNNEKNISSIYGTDGTKYNKIIIDEAENIDLHFINGREDIKKIYFHISDSTGKVITSQILESDDEHIKAKVSIDTSGEYDISFVIFTANGMELYVSDEYTFMEAISDMRIENQQLYMMKDISITDKRKEICINYPFIWNSNGHDFTTESKLIFKSELDGKMSINNGGESLFSTDLVTCHTPLWQFDIEKPFGEFNEEKYFYINAEKVNGKDIDATHLYVDTQEKLSHIIKYNSNIGIDNEETGTLILDKNIKKLTIVGDYQIGRVYVDTSLCIEMIGTSEVEYQGKNIDLIWEDEDAPLKETIERYMTVNTYNGETVDKKIGGMGTSHFLSGTLKLSSDRTNEMIVDGNYIDIYVGYADSIAPDKATLTYELSSNGYAEIIVDDGNYYCCVTDEKDNTRNYKLNFVDKKYNLPVIHIQTENGQNIASKENMIPGIFSIDYNGNEKYTNLSDVKMNIRGRGHSSWKLKKKPYKIKFDKKQSLFGLTEAKEWVLQANHADKSLIRNQLASNMGNILDNVVFTPHSFLVDVFVNEEYVGVYTLTEQIEVKPGRIEGDKDGTDLDTDYLLELGGEGENTSFGKNTFNGKLSLFVEIKNPDNDVLSSEQYEFIKDYVTKADNAVMNLEQYEEYIDIPSLVDWFILNEFSYNIDGTFRRSDYILKKKNDKLYMATYWDYDYAFGNFWRDSFGFDEWICYGNENTKEDNYIWDNWMRYLLNDDEFKSKLKTRWEQVGENLYNVAMTTINEASVNATSSAEENFSRWTGVLGYKTQYENSKVYKISTYEGQLQYLRDFIDKRYKWMDKTIKAM